MEVTNAVPEKISWKPLLIFTGVVLALAYIAEKEVSLPPPILMSAMAAAGGLLVATTLWRPEFALYGLVAYIPFSRVLPGDFGGAMTALNLTNILCLIVLLGWFSHAMQEGRFWENAPLHLPIILFALLGAISLVRGSMVYGSWYIWKVVIPLKRWLTPLLIYFLAFLTVRDRRALKTTVGIVMICVTVVGLMAVKDYIAIGEVGSIEKARVGGISEQPNMLAVFFVYYMFLLAAFWMCRLSKPKYWLLLIPFLVCFRGIQVTFSRGGYLAFFTGLFALAFFRGKRYFLLGLLFLIVALMNPIFLPKGIVYRLGSTFKPVEEVDERIVHEVLPDAYERGAVILEGSARQRLYIWRGALRMIADHPLWGTGYQTFSSIIPYYTPELKGKRWDAHNSYIIIAAEMGIPALLVFLWILWVAIRKTRWLYRHTRDPFYRAMALGFLSGLFGLLMGNMFGSRLHSLEVSGYFWVLCALVMRAILFEKRANAVPVKLKPTRPRPASKGEAGHQDLIHPKSLTASLRRFDEFKYGGKGPSS